MPSEQAAGRAVYASDIYALGLTAIYLLTGKIPQNLASDPLTGEIIWRQVAPQVSPSLAEVLDKAIMAHSRDRFATAKEMLAALQNNSEQIPPTITSSPLPTIPSPPPTLTPVTTTTSGTSQKGLIIAVTVAGILIGASIFGGFMISSNSKQQPQEEVATETSTPEVKEESTESQPEASPSPVIENSPVPKLPPSPPPVSTTPPQQQLAIQSPEVQSEQKGYYFVTDSAFSDSGSASSQVSRLQAEGYNGAGMFWIKDYPNLSNKPLYQVYAAQFSDRSSCRNFLQNYAQQNSESYCVFGSNDPNASPDRFYAQ
ncbi:MAG: hypothetical protein WBG70_07935 [Spirulinaceae cyanobacterium]